MIRYFSLSSSFSCSPFFATETYMKAGWYFSSSCCCNVSTISVIIPAAWNAIVRDGYAVVALRSLALGLDAGGMCALWRRQRVVLDACQLSFLSAAFSTY